MELQVLQFSGINQLLPEIVSGAGSVNTQPPINYAQDGMNFTIVNGQLERAKSPKEQTLSLTPVGAFLGEFTCTLKGNTINIVGYGTKLYTINGTVLTEIYSGLTNGNVLDFSVFGGKIIICNGAEHLEYDGSNVIPVVVTDASHIWNSAKPKGSFVWAGRLCYWGDSTYPNYIFIPDAATYNSFTSGLCDVLTIETGYGDKVTGCEVFTEDIVAVFTENAVARITGTQPVDPSATDPFKTKVITTSLGCIATKSIIKVGVDLFFLSTRGLEKFYPTNTYGDVGVSNFFQKIINDVKEFRLPEYQGDSFSIYDEAQSRCYIYMKTINDNTIKYGIDVNTGEIVEKCYYELNLTGGIYKAKNLYIGDNSGKYYSFSDNYYDDTESWYEFKWFTGRKSPLSQVKVWNKLCFLVETDSSLANLKLQHKRINHTKLDAAYSSINNALTDTTTLWDTAVWDTSKWDIKASRILQLNNLKKGNAIKFRVYNNTTNEHYRIKSMELYYTPIGVCK